MATKKNVFVRDTASGDTNDLQLIIRDLSTQLRDRKQANTLLNTENARLKRQLYDLTQRITSIESGKPHKRGEATTIGALRLATAAAKQNEVAMGQDFQQVLSDNQALQAHLAGLQTELAETQTGWKASRLDVEQLQQQSDELEQKCLAFMDQMEALQTELRATQKALADERQVRSNVEGRVGQLSQEMAANQAQTSSMQVAREQDRLTTEQQLSLAQQEAAELTKTVEAKRQESKEHESKAQSFQAQIQALEDQLAHLAHLAAMPVPEGMANTSASLLAGQQRQNKSSPATGVANAAGLATLPTTSANKGGSVSSNCLEVMLHEVSLTPEPAGLTRFNLWGMLTCSAPGMAQTVTLISCEPPADPIPINLRHQAEFDTKSNATPHATSAHDETLQALEVLTTQSCSLELYNLKTSLLGGLRCPAPADHPKAGQLIPMFACASQHGPQVTAVQLFTVSGGAMEPQALAVPLSVDWRAVLPPTAAAPRADEFVVPLRSMDPLMLESIRLSGLVSAGRSFTGTDGQAYQVWAAQDERTRRTATKKYLEQDLEVASDLAVASKPLATASVPLSAALAAPSAAAAQLDVMQQALQRQQRPGLYESAVTNGTMDVTLRTARDAPVGMCRATLRLAKDLPLSGPLLHALLPQAAPVNTSPSPGAIPAGLLRDAAVGGSAAQDLGSVISAAPLPPLHWACAMAAEAVALWRMVTHLRDMVSVATSALVGRSAVDPRDQDACQQAMLQATDAMQVLSTQLPGVWAACSAVCMRAQQVSAADGALACTWHTDMQRLARRCGLQCLLGLRQWHVHVTQAHAVAALLVAPTVTQATSENVVMPLTSQQQLSMLRAVEGKLLHSCQELGWVQPAADVTTYFYLAAATVAADTGIPANITAAIPRALRTAPAVLASQAPAAAASPASPLHPRTVTQALTAIQSAFDTSVPSLMHSVDACRKQISAPMVPGQTPDAVEATQACQQRLASLLCGVTSSLLQGCADIAKAATEADTPALPGQPGIGVARDSLGSSLQSRDPAGKSNGNKASSAMATALMASQVQLQVVLAQLSKVEPTGLPPLGQQAPGAWLKAAYKLSTQLSASRSLWVACWALEAAQALVVSGQRATAVRLVLEGIGAEAERVVQWTAARLTDLRSNRVYTTEVVQPCLESILPNLSQHLVALVAAVFALASQCLVMPTVLHTTTCASHHSSSHGAPARLSLQVAQLSCPCAPHPPAAASMQADAVPGDVPLCCFPHWAPKGTLLILSASPELPAGIDAPQPGTVAQGSDACMGVTMEEVSLQQAAMALGWRAVHLNDFRSAAGGPTDATGAAVPESQVLANACAAADAAVVLLSRSEAGPAVQRLRALGAVVIEPQQDSVLRRALVAAVASNLPLSSATGASAGPSTGLSTAVLDLARQLIARIAVATLAASKQPSASNTTPSRAAEAQQDSPVSTTTTPAQPAMTLPWRLNASTVSYCTDLSLAEPLLAASQAVGFRIAQALQALQPSAQGALLGAASGAMLQQASALMAQQQLQFEGLLLAPELATAPSPAPEASSALTPSRSFAGAAGDGSGRGLRRPSMTGGNSPALSLAGLPPMQRRLSTQQPPVAPLAAAAAAALLNQQTNDDAASTASEDAEAFVTPLSAAHLQASGMGARQAEDSESDAASVVSTSTAGARRNRQIR